MSALRTLTPFITLLLILFCMHAHANTYTVTTGTDNASGTNPSANAGTGTLRQAIIDANAHAGPDIISFNIAGGGTKTLTVSALLPLITEPVNINGYDQPGSVQGQLGTGNRIIRIQIDAGSASSGGSRPAGSAKALFCFTKNASFSSINGLSIYNTEPGVEAILVEPGASNIHIWGNYIGVLASGSSPASAADYNNADGIKLNHPSITVGTYTNITIGANGDNTNDANEGNVIANSSDPVNGGDGIEIGRTITSYTYSGVSIAGNYIGVAADGITAAPNGASAAASASLSNGAAGINLINIHNNIQIGSNGDNISDALERNIISGNYANGININACDSISIAGNYIGTDKSGTVAIPNAKNSDNNIAFAGIIIYGGSSNIIIGFDNARHLTSAAANVRNVISGNKAAGIDFFNNPSATNNRISGNYIGVDATGNTRLGNGGGNTPAPSGIFAAAIDLYNSVNTWVGTDGDGNNDALERNIINGSFQGNGVTINNNANSNVVAGNYIGLGANGTTAIGNDWAGIAINGSNNNRIGSDGNGIADANEKNIISGNLNNGIYIYNCDNTGIAGNYIGTDKNGTAAVPNGKNSTSSSNFFSIYVEASSRITIGFNDAVHSAAVAADVRNIISGNQAGGIYFYNNSAATNRIPGNYIGVDATGNTRLGNGQGNVSTETLDGSGICLFNTSNTLIGTNSNGDDDALERNIISGNIGARGISIDASGSNIVAGNYIGVGANGTTAIGNGYSGVALQNGSNSNRIGSNDDGANDAVEANIIANNASSTLSASSDGVRIINNSTGNRISRNSFYKNKANPIDLVNDGVSPNDGVTTAGQPNILLDYPVITSAAVAGTTVTVAGYVSTCGGAETTAGPSIPGNKTIQFYKEANDGNQDGPLTNGSCTRIVNHGEGIQYLGSITGVVNTFSTSFTLVAGATLTTSDRITGITIDAAGNTSEFGVATISNVLPVQILNFTATQKANTIVLNWTTATESNNLGFDIERSADGISFTKIGFVGSAAAGGNSNTLHSYTTIDAHPLNGTNYYRLKQADWDGHTTYSTTATANMRNGTSTASLSVYPNPVANKVSIVAAGIANFNAAYIIVHNSVGQVVRKLKVAQSLSTLDCGKLPSGVYYIAYTDAAGNNMQTMIVK